MNNPQFKEMGKLEGLLLGLLFLGFGFGMPALMWVSYGFGEFNLENLCSFCIETSIGLIIFLLLGCVGVYDLYLFFTEEVLKPKKDILLLKEIVDDGDMVKLIFVDRRGKKIGTYKEKKYYEVNRYYEVIRSTHFIKQIIGLTSVTFEDIKKRF